MSDVHGDDSLTALTAPVDPEKLAMLHRRLEAAAQAEDLVDVAYTLFDPRIRY